MAVYTEVSDEALTRFLTEYEIGQLVAFRGIAEGVENSNFSLRTSAGDYILTLYEKRVDPAELPWFLGLMEHLAGRGVVCPRPVHGRDGTALRQLCGRHAAITTFLPGVLAAPGAPGTLRTGRRSAGLAASGRRRLPAPPHECPWARRVAAVAQSRPRLCGRGTTRAGRGT